MNKYPDYIKRFKPRGTIVKKVRDVYYVYKATSKRVVGKSYPVQVIEGLVGRIDEFGFHTLTKTVVESKQVIIMEYGFTNYMLLFEPSFVNDYNRHRSKRDALIIYRSLIVYLSSNSFLVNDKKTIILDIEELLKRYKISLTKQLGALLKIIEAESFERVEQLKYICRVKMGNKEFKSNLNDIQRKLIKELGVEENDIR